MMPRKSCEFCKEAIGEIDYKDPDRLKRFMTTRGKVLSRRATRCCAYHQRSLARAIRRARQMALLPFNEAYFM
jgi:small subunit ribosomal protein S18